METNNNPKFCSQCGNSLPANAVFCPACGWRLKSGELDENLTEEDTEQEYEESEENGLDESVGEDESEKQLVEEEYEDEEESEEQQNEEECEEEEESEEQLDNEESFNKQEEEGFLKSFGKRFLKSFGRRVSLYMCVFVVGVIVYISWETNTNPFKFFIINPPVEVSVRGGYLSESVVQVRNDSDKPIEVQVCLYRQSSLGLGLIGARSSITRINPYETKDFGVLELEHKWDPSSGDKGFVFVNGHLRTLRFELSNSRWSSEFGFCSPDDSPFEVKRNGIFYKK